MNKDNKDYKNIKNKVAVCGLGTIGLGVAELILKNEDLKLLGVCDKREEALKEVLKLDKSVLTYDDYHKVLENKDVDIIVEVMGGKTFAYDLITKALKLHKNVVTANKEVVATYYKELVNLCLETGSHLLFEASVGGVVPIVDDLYNYTKVNNITHLEGIMNGSTNFVLTKVQDDGMSYAGAISLAKEKGFLEQDPSADLRGLDMMRKVVILSNIAYHTAINVDDVYTYSLENVSEGFLNVVRQKGYILKYMAESLINHNHLALRIEPVMVKENSLLSKIKYEKNYFSFESVSQGEIQLTGFGAGRYPTATAVVSDVIRMVSGKYNDDLKINKEYINTSNDELIDQYLIELQDEKETLDESLILIQDHQYLLTKKISGKELKMNLNKIHFYARVKEND